MGPVLGNLRQPLTAAVPGSRADTGSRASYSAAASNYRLAPTTAFDVIVPHG